MTTTHWKTHKIEGYGKLTMHPGKPYSETLITKMLIDKLGGTVIDDSIEGLANDRFIIAEAYLRHFEPDENINGSLHIYLAQRRGLELTERRELFLQLVEVGDMDALYDAYAATRRTALMAEKTPNPELLDLSPEDVAAIEKKD